MENQLEGIIGGNFPEIREPLSRPIADICLTAQKREEFEVGIGEVKQAYELFLNFYHDEYLPNATFNPSVSALPNGPRIYNECLQ